MLLFSQAEFLHIFQDLFNTSLLAQRTLLKFKVKVANVTIWTPNPKLPNVFFVCSLFRDVALAGLFSKLTIRNTFKKLFLFHYVKKLF